MKHIPIQQAEALTVSDLIKLTDSGTSSVVITEQGEQRFLFLPHAAETAPPSEAEDDLALEAAALSANPAFMAYLAECRARGDREGRISFEEMWREFGEGELPKT